MTVIRVGDDGWPASSDRGCKTDDSTNDGGKDELFFTAGPSNNLMGTFGEITVVK